MIILVLLLLPLVSCAPASPVSPLSSLLQTGDSDGQPGHNLDGWPQLLHCLRTCFRLPTGVEKGEKCLRHVHSDTLWDNSVTVTVEGPRCSVYSTSIQLVGNLSIALPSIGKDNDDIGVILHGGHDYDDHEESNAGCVASCVGVKTTHQCKSGHVEYGLITKGVGRAVDWAVIEGPGCKSKIALITTTAESIPIVIMDDDVALGMLIADGEMRSRKFLIHGGKGEESSTSETGSDEAAGDSDESADSSNEDDEESDEGSPGSDEETEKEDEGSEETETEGGGDEEETHEESTTEESSDGNGEEDEEGATEDPMKHKPSSFAYYVREIGDRTLCAKKCLRMIDKEDNTTSLEQRALWAEYRLPKGQWYERYTYDGPHDYFTTLVQHSVDTRVRMGRHAEDPLHGGSDVRFFKDIADCLQTCYESEAFNAHVQDCSGSVLFPTWSIVEDSGYTDHHHQGKYQPITVAIPSERRGCHVLSTFIVTRRDDFDPIHIIYNDEEREIFQIANEQAHSVVLRERKEELLDYDWSVESSTPDY